MSVIQDGKQNNIITKLQLEIHELHNKIFSLRNIISEQINDQKLLVKQHNDDIKTFIQLQKWQAEQIKAKNYIIKTMEENN